jgi:hypothetical protein
VIGFRPPTHLAGDVVFVDQHDVLMSKAGRTCGQTKLGSAGNRKMLFDYLVRGNGGFSRHTQDVRVLRGLAAGVRCAADCDFLDLLGASRHVEILHQARIHGIEALLFDCLSRGSADSSARVSLAEALKPTVVASVITEQLRRRILRDIHEDCAANDILLITLKGTALAYSLYQHPYHRSRGDTDLLVAEEDIARVEEILYRRGFVRDYRGERTGSGQAIFRGGTRAVQETIDLHWQVRDHLMLRDVMTFASIAEQKIPLPALSSYAYAPAPVDSMMLACLHRASNYSSVYHVDECEIIMPDRLVWLLDIDLLARRLSASDWQLLERKARDLRITRIIVSALGASQAVFGTALPEGLAQRLSVQRLSEPSARYLNLGTRNYVRAELLGSGLLKHRLALVWSWAVPDRATLRRKYGAMGGPVVLLYLWHWFRNLKKLWRS